MRFPENSTEVFGFSAEGWWGFGVLFVWFVAGFVLFGAPGWLLCFSPTGPEPSEGRPFIYRRVPDLTFSSAEPFSIQTTRPSSFPTAPTPNKTDS